MRVIESFPEFVSPPCERVTFSLFKLWKFNQGWSVHKIGGLMQDMEQITSSSDRWGHFALISSLFAWKPIGLEYWLGDPHQVQDLRVTIYYILYNSSPQGQRSNSDVICMDNLKSITLVHGTFIFPPLVWQIKAHQGNLCLRLSRKHLERSRIRMFVFLHVCSRCCLSKFSNDPQCVGKCFEFPNGLNWPKRWLAKRVGHLLDGVRFAGTSLLAPALHLICRFHNRAQTNNAVSQAMSNNATESGQAGNTRFNPRLTTGLVTFFFYFFYTNGLWPFFYLYFIKTLVCDLVNTPFLIYFRETNTRRVPFGRASFFVFYSPWRERLLCINIHNCATFTYLFFHYLQVKGKPLKP